MMHLPVVSLVVLAIGALASPLALDHSTSDLEKRVPCPDGGVHIIAVGGHGSPPHGYGLLNTTTISVLNAIPGSNNYSLPYPKNSEDFPTAVQIGKEHLTSYLAKFTTKCPDTKLVMMGYSEGAIVAMNTLCGSSHIGSPYTDPLPSSYADYFAAIIIYGDDTRVPDQPYDLGTCRKGQGVNPRGNPEGCAAFESMIVSYCDKPDPQCCSGNNISTHYLYPQKYNTVATQFAVDQFDATQGSSGSD